MESENHFKFLAEFCRYDMLCGGPDPHMAVVGHLSRDKPFMEKAWMAGCYIGVYNVPTAQVLWETFPFEKALEMEEHEWEAWIRENWKGLSFRRERRPVRTAPKLAKFMHTYTNWIAGANLDWPRDPDPKISYDLLWRECQQNVWGLGRYVALKLLEFYTRYLPLAIQIPDMRPKGGWSPRAALALLNPGYVKPLNGDDRPEHLRYAKWLFLECQMLLKKNYGVEVDMYNLQVLLCDYKQSVVGRRQYPGRAQDSELEHYHKIASYWPDPPDALFKAREEIFPHWALGEKNGWSGPRNELGHVLCDYGYTWTDSLYDYSSTTNLAEPVLK